MKTIPSAGFIEPSTTDSLNDQHKVFHMAKTQDSFSNTCFKIATQQ